MENDRNLRSWKDRWMFVTTFICRILSNVSTQGHSSGGFFFLTGLGIVATGREMKEAYVQENLMRLNGDGVPSVYSLSILHMKCFLMGCSQCISLQYLGIFQH